MPCLMMVQPVSLDSRVQRVSIKNVYTDVFLPTSEARSVALTGYDDRGRARPGTLEPVDELRTRDFPKAARVMKVSKQVVLERLLKIYAEKNGEVMMIREPGEVPGDLFFVKDRKPPETVSKIAEKAMPSVIQQLRNLVAPGGEHCKKLTVCEHGSDKILIFISSMSIK